MIFMVVGILVTTLIVIVMCYLVANYASLDSDLRSAVKEANKVKKELKELEKRKAELEQHNANLELVMNWKPKDLDAEKE
jgi:hypothetical protein